MWLKQGLARVLAMSRGFICLISCVTFSPFCTMIHFRSLDFRRMCIRSYILFGYVFDSCILTDIRLVTQNLDLNFTTNIIKCNLMDRS